MKTRAVPLTAALLAALLLSACNSKPYVMKESTRRTFGPRIGAVLDVEINDIEGIGSALDESPIPAGPNRKAKGKLKDVLAGAWKRADKLEIYYDRHRMSMTEGWRYFLVTDHYGHWLEWRMIDEHGKVALRRGQTPLPAKEAAATIIDTRFEIE